MAGQGRATDSRHGPVPLRQLPEGREHIQAPAGLQAAQLHHRGYSLVCAGPQITACTA